MKYTSPPLWPIYIEIHCPIIPVIISLYLKQIATEMVLMQYCIDVCTL